MEITGKVIEIGIIQKGVSAKGKEWANQTIVVEFQDGDYTKSLAVQFFKTDLLNDVSVGGNVAITFNVESKKYNERWFTNVNGWKIDIENLQPTSGNKDIDDLTENDLPF